VLLSRLGLAATLLAIPACLAAQSPADTAAILDHLSPELLVGGAPAGAPGHLAALRLPPELEERRAWIEDRVGPLCLEWGAEDGAGTITEVWIGVTIGPSEAGLYLHHLVPHLHGFSDYSTGLQFVRDSTGAWQRRGMSSGIGDGFGADSLPRPPPEKCVGES
jgi:hypothetical protein